MIKYNWSWIFLLLAINTLLLSLLVIKFKRIKTLPKAYSNNNDLIILDRNIYKIWLLIIITCAVLVRIYKLDFENLDIQEISYLLPFAKELKWHAETIMATSVKELFINQTNLSFLHQPLTSIILFLISLAKINFPLEILFRIPSVLFGVVTIWAVFLLGKELFNEKVGILASLVLTFNPYHLYFSRDLEPYSAVCLFTVIAYLLFIRIILKGEYCFGPIYLAAILAVLLFHLTAFLILFSHAIIAVVFWLKKDTAVYQKKNIVFYGITVFGLLYFLILWSPVISYSALSGAEETMRCNYFYIPANLLHALAVPYKLFQTEFGFSLQQIIEVLLLIAFFIYCLNHLRKNKSVSFIMVSVPILVIFSWSFFSAWYFYIHGSRFYPGYRWNICSIPLFSLVIAYAVDVSDAKSRFLFLKKKSLLLLAIVLILANNIIKDYCILTSHQKPVFQKALLSMNTVIRDKDICFFPVFFTADNFFYYLNRNINMYSPSLFLSVQHSRNYKKIYIYDDKEKTIPVLLRSFRGFYNRVWVVDVREQFFENDMFNHELADYIVCYLKKNYHFVLEKKLEYINLYLFDLQN